MVVATEISAALPHAGDPVEHGADSGDAQQPAPANRQIRAGVPRSIAAVTALRRACRGSPVARVRQSSRMRRRTLPLLIVILSATAGCVSVTPTTDNKPPQNRTTVSVPAPTSGREAGVALPLTPLPDSQPPAPAVAIAPVPEDSASAARPRQERHHAPKADGSGSGMRTVRKPERLPVKAKRSSPRHHTPSRRPRPRSAEQVRQSRWFPSAPARTRPRYRVVSPWPSSATPRMGSRVRLSASSATPHTGSPPGETVSDGFRESV